MKKRNILIIIVIVIILLIAGISILYSTDIADSKVNIDLGSISASNITIDNASAGKEVNYKAEIEIDMSKCNNTTEAKNLLKSLSKDNTTFDSGSLGIRLNDGSQMLEFKKEDIKLISIDDNTLIISISGSTTFDKDINFENSTISFLELKFKEKSTFNSHWTYLKT